MFQIEKYQKVVDGFQLVFFLGRIAVDVDGGATDDDARREQLVAGRPLLDRRVPLTVEPGLAVGIYKQSAKEAMIHQATILVAQVSENFHDQAKTRGYQGNSRNTFFSSLGYWSRIKNALNNIKLSRFKSPNRPKVSLR